MGAQKIDKELALEIRKEDLEHFVKSETECCLCGAPLIGKHEVDYMTLKIHETLDCSSCKVTLKNTTSTLH